MLSHLPLLEGGIAIFLAQRYTLPRFDQCVSLRMTSNFLSSADWVMKRTSYVFV